ncbi:hypothetical protein ED28_07000 [[Pantoea] beijingensis]|uniref:Uncharacterized protein n=1 Tax=[Pantoea] beijingensis TaxID=1324864 RepID=A0A443IEX0_9GAMM|nr:hypothetical protein [[Pantoea] beijingensis]RWR02605.1 hypothetical protein ED28_07000 [[Pantoea] beijingensis]
MRPLPEYPSYRIAHPPDGKRWLLVGALLAVLCSGGGTLLHRAGSDAGLIVKGMAGAVVLLGVLWLIRLLYYRASAHNARYYAQLVERQQQVWWAQHQHRFALSEMVLMGPAGTDTPHWLHLLKREHRAPEKKNEPGGKALRIGRTLVDPGAEREALLAKMLVLQWQAQMADSPLPHIRRYYWQGSLAAWRAFCAQMQDSFADVALPEHPEKWQGEETLSALAATAQTLPENEAILVAGCHSMTASFNSTQPAGESAALCLVAQKGQVSLTRGEFYDIAGEEVLTAVCERAEQQSELEEAPDACMLFSQPALPALAQSGWNVTHHVQNLNWGNPGEMEMLIVLTLAALYAKYNQEPCGWIAKDPLHTLALGIVKPYGEGK